MINSVCICGHKDNRHESKHSFDDQLEGWGIGKCDLCSCKKFDDLLEDLHNKQSKLAEIICGDFVKELCIKVASEISKEKLKEFAEHKARQLNANGDKK